MERKRKQVRVGPPVWLDVLAGAAAGALGSWLMSPAQKGLSRLQSAQSLQWEKQASNVPATVVLARRATEVAGLQLPKEAASRAGQAVHYGYGAVVGALYALVLRRRPGRAVGSGLLMGALLWLLGDEVLVPAMRLSPPPEAFPVSTHLKALGAHLAYGAATDGAVRLVHRALA